jgi:predicted lipoprotein with Yx(FWY)xxD motif
MHRVERGRSAAPARWCLVVAASALLVLAACGSSSKTSTSATTAASSATTGASSTTTIAAGGVTVKTAGSSFGTILVDAQGFTLYHFDKDSGTTVACVSSCAQTWPPLMAPSGGAVGAGVTGLGTVARPDGTEQVTYNGKTLYRYSRDTAPGQTNGNGIAGLWHVVTATPATGAGSSTTVTPSSAGGSGY